MKPDDGEEIYEKLIADAETPFSKRSYQIKLGEYRWERGNKRMLAKLLGVAVLLQLSLRHFIGLEWHWGCMLAILAICYYLHRQQKLQLGITRDEINLWIDIHKDMEEKFKEELEERLTRQGEASWETKMTLENKVSEDIRYLVREVGEIRLKLEAR